MTGIDPTAQWTDMRQAITRLEDKVDSLRDVYECRLRKLDRQVYALMALSAAGLVGPPALGAVVGWVA